MSGITKVTSTGPAEALQNSPQVISEEVFEKLFGSGKSLEIYTDESQLSGNKSISSMEIGDCITVFAVEKENGKTDCIMGWHLDDGSTIDGIKKQLEKCGDSELEHDFYIIGGNQGTTQGEGCLLENIREAISGYFIAESKIVFELVNPNADGKFKYVSANLQMNGTLSYCHH
jgi:hypothetical protein